MVSLASLVAWLVMAAQSVPAVPWDATATYCIEETYPEQPCDDDSHDYGQSKGIDEPPKMPPQDDEMSGDVFGAPPDPNDTIYQLERCVDDHCVPNGEVHTASNDTIYGQRGYKVCPAEHVIEIRTKRQANREIGVDCNFCDDTGCTLVYCETPSAKECKADEVWSLALVDEKYGDKQVRRWHYYCTRSVREVWIDNVRWGVLKETGDK